jgi:hypothetical protein
MKEQNGSIMSPKISPSLTAGLVIASLALSLGAASAAATVRERHAAIAAHRVHHANAAHRWRHFAHHFPPADGSVNAAPKAFIEPGYVFVPGLGILDEDCDMPTSTCPNDVRDIQ